MSITKKGFKYIKGSITKLPYPLIPFFLSMFVVVASLNYQQISNEIYKLLSNSIAIFKALIAVSLFPLIIYILAN